MLQAAPKSRGHASPGAASTPRVVSPGPGRCAEPGCPQRSPPNPPREQGSSSAPTHVPGRHAAPGPGLGTTRSSAKLPLGPSWPSCGRAGVGQLKTTYSIFIFFKHMLVYENNHPGTVQAYTDKSTLQHEGLPKEWGKASTHPLSGSSTATERGTAVRGPFRNGIPRPHQYSSCRS